MALYKDLQNRIYDDMDGTAIHLLPVGTIPIAKADADSAHSSARGVGVGRRLNHATRRCG